MPRFCARLATEIADGAIDPGQIAARDDLIAISVQNRPNNNGRNRRTAGTEVSVGEGRRTQAGAATKVRPPEPVFVPLSRHSELSRKFAGPS
jgi:hypothetical protein